MHEELNNSIENLADVTAIIMTNNEEKHLERCINSLKSTIKNIVVIDSYSKDSTLSIAKKHNIKVLQNEWINYSKQFNWGIENSEIVTEWVFRIDPDKAVIDINRS